MCPRRCGVWYIPGTRTRCWSTRGEQTSTGLGEHERPRWQPAYGARDRQDPAAGPREARYIAPAGRGGYEDPGQVPPRPGERELRGAACRVYARLPQDLRRAPWTGRSGNNRAAEVPPAAGAWLSRLVHLSACPAVRVFKRVPSTLPGSVTGFPTQWRKS